MNFLGRPLWAIMLVSVGFGQISISGNTYVGYGKSKNDFNFSEDRVDLNGYWNNWTGWLQFELADPPQLGRDVKGLRKFRVEYSKNSYTIKFGDLYEFWGKGLVMNMVDDQAINFDTGIRGVLVSWSNDKYYYDALGGAQEIWRSSNQVVGFDDRVPNYGIDNKMVGGRAGMMFDQSFIEFQLLNVNEDHPNPGTKITENISHKLYGINFNYFGKSSDFTIELAKKDRNGSGIYGDGNIYLGPWSIGLSYKNYLFASLSPYERWDFVNNRGGALTLQQMPTVFKEHNTSLLGKITHIIDYNDELGFHLRAEGPLFAETMLAIHFSQSSRHNEWVMDQNWEWEKSESKKIYPSTDPLYNPFKEYFAEITGYALDNKFYYVIGYARTEDVVDIYLNRASDVYRSYSYEFLEAKTIPTHFTYRLGNLYSIDILFEYQEKKKGVKLFSNYPELGQDLFDSLYLNDKQINRFISLGVAKSPRWSATLSVDYSNTDERIVIANDRKNNAIEKALDTLWDTSLTWANFEMVFNVNQKTRLSLSYGSQRGGVFCSNGVCRYIQPFENGYKLGIISSF
jgi:hypothetical protein